MMHKYYEDNIEKFKVLCDYCGNQADLVNGSVVYPHRADLKSLQFYHCTPCSAYVGVHKNSKELKPLGRLADKELRIWKQNAHTSFDNIWRGKEMSRTAAYSWLASNLGTHLSSTHIGMFDVAMCKKVVEVCRQRQADTRQCLDTLELIKNIIYSQDTNTHKVRQMKELLN